MPVAALIWVLLALIISLVIWFLTWPRTMPAPDLSRRRRSREEEAPDAQP